MLAWKGEAWKKGRKKEGGRRKEEGGRAQEKKKEEKGRRSNRQPTQGGPKLALRQRRQSTPGHGEKEKEERKRRRSSDGGPSGGRRAEPRSSGGGTRAEGEGRGPESCGRRPERRKEGRRPTSCGLEARAKKMEEERGGRSRKERRKKEEAGNQTISRPKEGHIRSQNSAAAPPANERSWRKGRAQKVRRGERRARRAARALRDSTLERCPGREKAAVIAAVHNEEEIAPSRGCRNTLRRGESACSHQVTSEPKRCSQKVAGTEEGLIHDKDLEGPQRQPAGQSLADQRGQKGPVREKRARTGTTPWKKRERKEPSGRESRTNPTKKRMGWARR
jgi:hypothetical protein